MKPALKRLAILISGNGSNLQAIINACQTLTLQAKIVIVVSDKPDAYGLIRAKKALLSTAVLTKTTSETRLEYDLKLIALLETHQLDFIVLAGFMRLLSPIFIKRFQGKIINIHPALPGQFAGINAIERALKAYGLGLITHTGVMVHQVDEGIDTGPVLQVEQVMIEPEDTLETLSMRIHKIEHRLLVKTLCALCQD